MSGHSKWNNIKRKKEASDAAKGAVFTKVAKEIMVAVKAGGPDPDNNSKLKDVIAKAKAANMPNDNINRAIKKAAGAGEGDDYEEIVYEGYGPGGIAIMVRTLTNNRCNDHQVLSLQLRTSDVHVKDTGATILLK